MGDDEWGLCKRGDICTNSFTICNNCHYLYVDNNDNSDFVKTRILERFYGTIEENNIISCFQFNHLFYIILFSTNEIEAEEMRKELISTFKNEDMFRFSIVVNGKEFLRVCV